MGAVPALVTWSNKDMSVTRTLRPNLGMRICTYVYRYVYTYYMYVYIYAYMNTWLKQSYKCFKDPATEMWFSSMYICMYTCLHKSYVYIYIRVYLHGLNKHFSKTRTLRLN